MMTRTSTLSRAVGCVTRADRRRVLVVDDDADMREMLGEVLALAGHEALLARDGLEAVELARQVHPDALTLDLGLPRLDGNGVLRALAATPSTARIPVIVVSADLDRLVRTSQVVAILDKPFSLSHFFASVEAALRPTGPHSAAIPA